MISIVVPTNRIGGLDVLFDSLERQTCRDFELVLVDNIHQYRAELVAERAKQYSFPVVHVPPRENPFPKVCYCRTMNTGILHASGSALLYLCDYCWLAPDAVETHADFQERVGAPFFADFAYTEFPEPACKRYCHDVHPESDPHLHTKNLKEVTRRYKEGLDKGWFSKHMWSVFKEPVDDAFRLPLELGEDGKPLTHYKLDIRGELASQEAPFPDYNFCCFKNESFPLELLLEMNGHDEDYDQSHGWQDQEFSYRLREMGISWWHAPHDKGEVRCVNPRKWLNVKEMPSMWKFNMALCDHLKPPTAAPVNHDFSLREMRDGLHGS
jgi:glycosyltransferase involved in cell wall biosynthesis